jgi:cbb3-type cytochrome oxidase maturation protein
MNVLVVLVPVSLVLAIAGLLTFLWTLRSEQYDDLDGDAWRILVEDDIKSTARGATSHPSDVA